LKVLYRLAKQIFVDDSEFVEMNNGHESRSAILERAQKVLNLWQYNLQITGG